MRVSTLLATLIVLFHLKGATTQCPDPIDVDLDPSLPGLGACSGYITVNGDRVCGNLDNDAARRACWERGLGMSGNTRIRRCFAQDNVPDATFGGQKFIIEAGTIGEECNLGSPECFTNCHEGGGGVDATSTQAECGGSPIDAAISCRDVNECLEGVLMNCQGPFDKDCHRERACGENADCSNTNSGYDCTCRPGYEGDAFDLHGCEDIDECIVMPGVNPCGPDMCQNIPGSYVCLCRDGYSWDPILLGCPVDTCMVGDLLAIPNAVLDTGRDPTEEYLTIRTYTCDAGFEPSVSGSSSFTTSCRADGRWCSCMTPTCQPIKCGIPPMDANANAPQTSGLYLETLTYTCPTGFRVGALTTYSRDCNDDGTWDSVADMCEDINECEGDPCPANSMCYNTYGSHLCLCNPGYKYSGDACVEISCGAVPAVSNAERLTSITVSDGTLGMVVRYRCEPGFKATIESDPSADPPVTEFQIECKLDECWSPQPIPECISVSCGDPGTVHYSKRSAGTFYYRDKVTYTCLEGFRPSDSTTSNPYRSFEITCMADGDWSPRQTCVDINECSELDYPCGPGDGHNCINKRGSYTCSCAPAYRLDNTGQKCIGFPPYVRDIHNPCEFYKSLQFCQHGDCINDGPGVPRCKCRPGYTGAFCDRPDKFELTLPFILAIIANVLALFPFLVCLVLACYVCCQNHDYHHRVPGHYTPTYGTPPTAPVLAPAYRKWPRLFASGNFNGF